MIFRKVRNANQALDRVDQLNREIMERIVERDDLIEYLLGVSIEIKATIEDPFMEKIGA
jgi:hypothetical protein